MVITCAAADDITAWCMLAAVIAIVKAGSFVSSLYVIAFSIAYVLIMLKVVKPFLTRVGELHSSREVLSKPIVAIFFLTLLISSMATEVIGIHALFGAFMAGAIMPDNTRFRSVFIEKIEDVAIVLLLPLFFVYTGLRTEIGLLNDPQLWWVTGFIIFIAVAGKFFGSALAAKFVGQSLKDSLTIGALMNTRGLMELVVLNIGYDLGVLSPEIFAMMVIMALTTTVMTGPALDLINWAFKNQATKDAVKTKEINKYKILFSFDGPESGRTLLRLAHGLTRKRIENVSITAMHLTPANELHHFNVAEYEKECFAPVIEESQKLNQKFISLFKASNDIDSEIANVANRGGYDLLLVGLGQSIFEGSLLGRLLGFTTRIINPEKLLNTVTGKEKLFDHTLLDERTRLILSRTDIPVGIFIDRELKKIEHAFIPVYGISDRNLMMYAQMLIQNLDTKVIVIDADGQLSKDPIAKEWINTIEKTAPGRIAVQSDSWMDASFLRRQDLMMVSLETWKKLVEVKGTWISDIPSTLILAESPEVKN